MVDCPDCDFPLEPDTQNIDSECDDKTLYVPMICKGCGKKWRACYDLGDMDEVA